ncbi:MAG: SDR family NAD(P)-dependent oxidoreductase [Fidelibacterota bacterium]
MSRSVFITGASSGIGEYLAYAHARRGDHIGLFARRKDKLDKIAAACRQYGVTCAVFPGDVTMEDDVKQALQSFHADRGQIDIVYANAGIGAVDPIWRGDSKEIVSLINVNVLGVIHTVYPTVPLMIKQQSGTIVVISSVAAFRGLPRHGSYSGSKAAVRAMVDGWRYDLTPNHIHIMTIHPGFIATPMVRNNSFLPFLMPVEKAADEILRAVDKKKKNYVFPWPWRLILPLLKSLPDIVVGWALYRR